MSDEKMTKLQFHYIDVNEDLEDGTKLPVARVMRLDKEGKAIGFLCQHDPKTGVSWLMRENAIEFATAILTMAVMPTANVPTEALKEVAK